MLIYAFSSICVYVLCKAWLMVDTTVSHVTKLLTFWKQNICF
uniref:Uncharacterized protein n=1 Tax=Rhizophora mucronata TaxID=61149 RepID=A0A2P2IHV2_RHIMU